MFEKTSLKHSVATETEKAFRLMRQEIQDIILQLEKEAKEKSCTINFKTEYRGDYEFEVRFGGDVLIFTMHSNIFEFSRDHEVMKTSYIKEDKNRSYCGIINIYNFLTDSFTFNRENDLGYLIGRIFVNFEGHYFIEGKREIGLLYNSFNSSVISKESVRDIVESAMLYTINFDLLTPPYDAVKMVSVSEIKSNISNIKLTTGKRLGFRFQSDTE